MDILVYLYILTGLAAALNCRPEGPVLPKPPNLADASAFRHAVVDLAHAFDAISSGSMAMPWPVANFSFSVAVVSVDQKEGTPIWQYHHRAEGNVKGTEKVDADSQYLIGSISKMVTTYIMLATGMDLDVPLKTYLPLLKGSEKMEWESITLRMLASQMAGVPTNYGFSDYYFLKDVYLALGFPPIDDSEYPPCGVIGLNQGCTANQLQVGLRDSYPIVPPGARPSYSNAAFNLIALAIETHTNRTYAQQVYEFVTKPLNLSSATRPSPGDDGKAVIPPGDTSGWGADYGINAPGGGLVSSVADLSKLAHAILSRRSALSPAQTRQWLKPVAYTGGMASAVGMPWEIRRHGNLTPNHPHPVTVHGKGGGAPLYRSQISLVDDYGLGIVVLTAGDMHALMTYIYEATLSVAVAAADAVTREYAEREYAGVFQNPNGDETDATTATVRATLVLDEDSLAVSSLTRGDADILAGWVKVFNESLGMFGPRISNKVRLFPTGLAEETVALQGGESVVKEVWRLWPELVAPPAVDLPGSGLEHDGCMGWTVGDWIHYGGEPLDRVVFYRKGRDVVGFEVPFLRSGVMRAHQ